MSYVIPGGPALSLEEAVVLGGMRDWSEDPADAWIYGVVVGWGTAVQEVADRHGWSDEEVRRLGRMRAAFEGLLAAEKASPVKLRESTQGRWSVVTPQPDGRVHATPRSDTPELAMADAKERGLV